MRSLVSRLRASSHANKRGTKVVELTLMSRRPDVSVLLSLTNVKPSYALRRAGGRATCALPLALRVPKTPDLLRIRTRSIHHSKARNGLFPVLKFVWSSCVSYFQNEAVHADGRTMG